MLRFVNELSQKLAQQFDISERMVSQTIQKYAEERFRVFVTSIKMDKHTNKFTERDLKTKALSTYIPSIEKCVYEHTEVKELILPNDPDPGPYVKKTYTLFVLRK